MEQRYRTVEEMPVYQLFYSLALDVERETRDFGSDFRWLRWQMLRSSESVCINMTEGFYAQYSTEYVQSLYRSRREARETEKHLMYARDVVQMRPEVAASLLEGYAGGTRQLGGLIGSIEKKIALRGKGKPGYGVVREEAEDPIWREEDHPLLSIDHRPSTINH